MGFRVKGNNSILKRMIGIVSSGTDKITDFNPGSAIRTLLESVSLQIEEFYYDLKQSVEYAVKNAGYESFGFNKNAARKANGYVTIHFMEELRKPIVIERGTVFYNTDKSLSYMSTRDIQIQDGTLLAVVPVECQLFGAVGNVKAGEITKMAMGFVNIDYISNPEPLTNGRDEETEKEREIRFKEHIHTLQRGTTESIVYGIKQVPGVAGVWIDDNHIGFINAYVHDKNGDLSPSLMNSVTRAVNDYRAAGIEVEIKPVVKKYVNVNIKVAYKDGIVAQAYNEDIRQLIIDYINRLRVSEDLNISNLIAEIYGSYRRVVVYVDVDNTNNVTTQNNEVVRCEDVVVSEIGG